MQILMGTTGKRINFIKKLLIIFILRSGEEQNGFDLSLTDRAMSSVTGIKRRKKFIWIRKTFNN